jgi:23S rRNA (pseudouridine1915-N3)-methyltransferase
MKLTILAVGRLKTGPETVLFDRYCERIRLSGRRIGITELSIRQIAESQARSSALRREDETLRLSGALDATDQLILLDERGKDMSSMEFSEMIARNLESSANRLVFAIGGPDGFADGIQMRAFLRLRLGRMTWPHQIVRILLAEQIYRAVTITSGHPYHRA